MVDFKEIRNIGQLRDARMELRGALDSRRRALELSLSHLKESWKPANVIRLAFRGMAVDLSETVLHIGLRLKDYILRKWEEKKARREKGATDEKTVEDPLSNMDTENSAGVAEDVHYEERREEDTDI